VEEDTMGAREAFEDIADREEGQQIIAAKNHHNIFGYSSF